MRVLALDPGTEKTAWCSYDTDHADHTEAGILPNATLIDGHIGIGAHHMLAVEMVASYGMPVGREVFETVLWAGMFIREWERSLPQRRGKYALVYRKDVKMHLCGRTAGVNDAVIRRALLDLFPRSGGGKTPQIGTKAKPGPLYGFKADMWAALGVAVTYAAKPWKYHPIGSR